MADNIILECIECGERDHLTKKNKRKHPERLALKKYYPCERKTTLHRETKQLLRQQVKKPAVSLL